MTDDPLAIFARWEWACTVARGLLTGSQRAVLQLIARRGGSDGSGAFPSREEMAATAGIAVRTVSDVTSVLEQIGLITGQPRPGTTTIWTANLDWTPAAHCMGQSDEEAANPCSTPAAPLQPTAHEGRRLKAVGPSVGTPDPRKEDDVQDVSDQQTDERAMALVQAATDALYERRFAKPDFDAMVQASRWLQDTTEFRKGWIEAPDLIAVVLATSGARSWRAFFGSQRAVLNVARRTTAVWRERNPVAASKEVAQRQRPRSERGTGREWIYEQARRGSS
jgi:hypothetical protein